MLYLVMPIIGGVVTVYLMTQLDVHALTLGLIWLAVGVIVLGIVTRGFRRQPPEIEYVEADDDEMKKSLVH
jgi:membrane protein YdbS with pleckstrin-like domain